MTQRRVNRAAARRESGLGEHPASTTATSALIEDVLEGDGKTDAFLRTFAGILARCSTRVGQRQVIGDLVGVWME